MELDDESASLVVQMPKEKRNKVTAIISTFEFSTHAEEHNSVKMFLVANEIYIKNLIAGKETPNFKDQLKGKVPAGTIIYQPFTLELKECNGVEDVPITGEGELLLIYTQYKGLTLCLRFKQFEILPDDYLSARFLISQISGEDPKPKTMRLEEDLSNGWCCLVPDSDLDKYLKSRLAVEIIFQRELQKVQAFAGIKNEGNTCYMNSILQILFFLRPLRKMIVEYQGEGKIILALREIFLNLLEEPLNLKRPVDAEQLIEAYGRFSDFPRRQQDTHQFLLGFLEQLEGEFPSLAQLWQGQSKQLLQSVEPEKPYQSSAREDFNGLDLPLEDYKGNTFGQLIDSLHYLLNREQVQDKIDTDDYGKVSVIKSREFQVLPPVLFLTLKRYQFKKYNSRPTKILADLNYPPEINLGFFHQTATGQDMEYQLYAIVVHRGQHYNSGHYCTFLNTSSAADSPKWMRFDDSRVYLSSQPQALNFTGGKFKIVAWNNEFQRFLQKQKNAEDTAYILVYFKRQCFNEYQSIDVPIPKEWARKKRAARVRQQKQNQEELFQVEVAVADLSTDYELFADPPTIPVGLKHNQDIVSQFNKLDYNLLGCKVGSVWKVNKREAKIKRLIEFADLPQTPSRIFDPQRGKRRPDYILIVPSNTPVYRSVSSLVNSDNLGFVRLTIVQQDNISSSLHLIRKSSLQDFITEQEKRLQRKGSVQIQQKQSFLQDWNDICSLIFE